MSLFLSLAPLFSTRIIKQCEGALSKPKGPFFRENEAQEMTPKLLALAKVCSVLGNIRDVSWHLSKRGSELEKRWTYSIFDINGAHQNKACITISMMGKFPKYLFSQLWQPDVQNNERCGNCSGGNAESKVPQRHGRLDERGLSRQRYAASKRPGE